MSTAMRAAAFAALGSAATRTGSLNNPDPLDRAMALCELADLRIAHSLTWGYRLADIDRNGFVASDAVRDQT
jgi:hypothetical protein